MNKKYSVFVDLDGVLADFDKKIDELFEKEPFSRRKMWRLVEEYDKDTPFYESLDKTKDADLLWDFITNNFAHIEILSAAGYTPKDGPEQKRNWVKKHFGDVKVNIVTTSPDKAGYALNNRILIDDRQKSIIPWVKAGGIGIYHGSALGTLSILETLL